MTGRIAIAAALLVLIAAAPAGAMSLKGDVSVGENVVRLGDIFAGGGEHADIALFHAPAPGSEGIVSIDRLRQAVRRLGLSWAPPFGLNHIKISRAEENRATTIALATIRNRLVEAIADTLPGERTADDIAVTLAPDLRPVVLKGSGKHEIDIARLDVDRRRGSFEASVEVSEDHQASIYRFSGDFEEFIEVPVLAADARRGEIIGPEHLTTLRTGRSEAGLAAAMDDIVGKAARRHLRAGTSPRLTDVEEPKVITRGQLVTVIFQQPGMTLTTQGRALDAGAVGETVAVRNVTSNRIIHAVATAPGRATVSMSASTHLAMR